ncbi:MAG: hypothetical protein ACRYFS_25190 [Janthinobacterium lividum]
MAHVIATLFALILLIIWFAANFYLFCQWLVYPKLRRRFQVCKPYLLLGWLLYILGGSILKPLGKVQNSAPLDLSGSLIGFIGFGLTIYAAVRFFKANASARRESKATVTLPVAEGSWPPPPSQPTP